MGLIDELGGTDAAIKYAAGEAELGEKDAYQVRIFPAPRTLADLFGGGAEGTEARSRLSPKIELSITSALNFLPAAERRMITEQLQMAELLQKRPVILMSPIVVTPR